MITGRCRFSGPVLFALLAANFQVTKRISRSASLNGLRVGLVVGELRTLGMRA